MWLDDAFVNINLIPKKGQLLNKTKEKDPPTHPPLLVNNSFRMSKHAVCRAVSAPDQFIHSLCMLGIEVQTLQSISQSVARRSGCLFIY